MKKLIFLISIIIFLCSAFPVNAYYTGMPASVVIGQTDFLTSTPGTSQTKIGTGGRGIFVDPRGRLIFADGDNNNRVLIWNKIPETNGTPADLVLGQADFNSGSANRGQGSPDASTLNIPMGVWSDGNKLIVGDTGNNRALIWNNFPTSNGQPADVVVGQTDFSGSSTACDATHVSGIRGIAVYNGKLVLSDNNNNRVLIYNSIPASNGGAADIVIGQASLSSCLSGQRTQTLLRGPRGVFVEQATGRLTVADRDNNRVMIWNTFPIQNTQPADVVVGRLDFTSSVSPGPFSGTTQPQGVFSDGRRLFVTDPGNDRVLIWNNFPTSNNQPADLVIGQPNFTSTATGTTASTYGIPSVLWQDGNRLLVADTGGTGGNARILIYNNILSTPAMNINPPTSVANKIRIAGNISLGERPNYRMQKVTAVINGGNENNVTFVDGGRDNGPGNTLYEFYNDFNPTIRGGDPNNYTINFRAQSFNADEDKYFYFTPFSLDKVTIENTPTFTFTVNQTFRDQLKNNLVKYQIWYKPTSAKAPAGKESQWQLYIDNIPTSQENSGKIVVKGITKLLKGKYQFQVKAINVMYHEQQSNNLNITLKK